MDNGASLRDRATAAEPVVSALRDGIPSARVEQISVAEFHRRLKAQGVPTMNDVALVCPVCRTVQSMRSLVNAGASPEEAERYIGFSCEGRLTNAGPYRQGRESQGIRGCDWSLGGLFRVHELEVITDDGATNPRFVVASPAEAQALAQAMSAGTAETQKAAQGEARQRGPKDAPNPSPIHQQDRSDDN